MTANTFPHSSRRIEEEAVDEQHGSHARGSTVNPAEQAGAVPNFPANPNTTHTGHIGAVPSYQPTGDHHERKKEALKRLGLLMYQHPGKTAAMASSAVVFGATIVAADVGYPGWVTNFGTLCELAVGGRLAGVAVVPMARHLLNWPKPVHAAVPHVGH